MKPQARLPLDDVLVVERAGRLAGGVCALLLSDLGAQVVRFEEPDEALPLALEGQAAANLSALLRVGRHRVRYDPDDFARLLDLADVAIVAPQDARAAPEVDMVRVRRDRLVGCIITPYGMAGPAGDLPPHGDELTLQAVTGLMGTTGLQGGPPMPGGVPLAEMIGGINAAVSVLAALRVRDAGGGGQLADLALFDGVIATMGTFMPLVLAGGVNTLRQGCRHPMTAPWNVYPTADGSILVCTTTDAQWRRLLVLAGRDDCLDDPRFASAAERVRHVDAVDAVVSTWSARRSGAELIAALAEAGVPAGAVRAIPDLMCDEALRAQGVIREVHDEAGRACLLAGSVVNLSGNGADAMAAAMHPLDDRLPAGLLQRPKPAVAQSGSGEPGASQPLAGVRVLEVTLYTAGPMAARNLASLGADVIKVEVLGGEPCRTWSPGCDGASLFFTNNNCGKRALALDLKHEEGRGVFVKLAASCDVLLENMRPGSLERLGLGHAALSEANPKLVYCSVSGYGRHGPNAAKAAYDTVIQAESGLMSLLSADGAIKMGVSIADMMGAIFAPLAVLAALRVRERDGRGRHIDVSMQACTAWLTQLSWPDGDPGLPPWERLEGCDGYVLATAAPEQVRSALAGCEPHTLPCDVLVSRLEAHGLAAVRIRELAEVLASDHVAERGLLHRLRNRNGNPVPVLAPPYRLEQTPARLERHIGGVGADTDPIRAELGYTPAQTAQLRHSGAIR